MRFLPQARITPRVIIQYIQHGEGSDLGNLMQQTRESVEFLLRRLKQCGWVLAGDHEPSHHRLAGNQVSILAERPVEIVIDF